MLILLLTSLILHDDDPKVLDRQPPYRGPGYRQALDADKRGLPQPDTVLLELKAWLPLAEFGFEHVSANDCWGYTSPSGREYALIGLSHGTGFVDLSEPGDPRVVAVIAGPASIWRDIKVYQDHAYVVTESGIGIQVIDMGAIDEGGVSEVTRVNGFDTPATHNVAINTASGFLYRCGGGPNGLRFYDLSDPDSPVYVGGWFDMYVHDAQVVTYEDGPYAGREIAFCCAGFNNGYVMPGLAIVDVSDKANPVLIHHYQYSGPAYSHQGWLSEDRTRFYLNDELDERSTGDPTTTRVINVSNLSAPFEMGTVTNGNSAIDHNMYTRGSFAFAANYRSGLRVFREDGDALLTEVASFDTYPENDAPNFNGLWSNYPYFDSGIVIGSDIERGLFVWKFHGFEKQWATRTNSSAAPPKRAQSE